MRKSPLLGVPGCWLWGGERPPRPRFPPRRVGSPLSPAEQACPGGPVRRQGCGRPRALRAPLAASSRGDPARALRGKGCGVALFEKVVFGFVPFVFISAFLVCHVDQIFERADDGSRCAVQPARPRPGTLALDGHWN